MGFWGKLGKVALKVAPYAAMAIPGVGVPLGMAIGGATSAASKKLEGGSWKQAALSGAIGAGTGAVGAGALKGIGPTSSGLTKFLGGAAGKTTGTGAAGVAGRVLGNAALSKVTGGASSDLGKYGYGNTSNTGIWENGNPADQIKRGEGGLTPRQQVEADNKRVAGGGSKMGAIGGSIGAMLTKYAADRAMSGNGASSPSSSNPAVTGRPNTQNFPGAGQSQGGQTGIYSGNMRGLGPVMGRRDQNVPNFAESIGAGRQDAMRNQPFRGGYDMITQGPEPADDAAGNIGPQIRTAMPPIYPNFGGNRRKRAS